MFERHKGICLITPILVPQMIAYIITLKSALHLSGSDQELMGVVTLAQRSNQLPPDIGWSFLPAYMGKGYATEAAGALLSFVQEEWELEVCALPDLGNRASERVAEKLGFVEGGVVRGWDSLEGEPEMIPVMVLRGMTRVDCYGIIDGSEFGQRKMEEIFTARGLEVKKTSESQVPEGTGERGQYTSQ